MEFIYGEVGIAPLVSLFTAGTEVEGELPLPEGRRAAETEVLCAKGSVRITKCTAAEGAVVTEGRVRVQLLCRDRGCEAAEGESGAKERGDIFAFSTSAAFRHTADAPDVKEGMRAEAFAEMLTTDIEPGARLAFTAALALKVVVTENVKKRCVSDIRGAQAELLHTTHAVYRVEELANEELSVRDEQNAPGVARVLCSEAYCTVHDVRTAGDTAFIEGSAQLSSLVVSDSGVLETFEAKLPLSLEVPLLRAANGKAFAELAATDAQSFISDEGKLCTELTVRCRIHDAAGCALSLVEDAYIPSDAHEAVREELRAMVYAQPVALVCRVQERCKAGAPNPERVLWSAASPVVTSCIAEGGEIHIEGVVSVSCAYLSAEGSIVTSREELPFEGTAQCRADAQAAFTRAEVSRFMVSASGGRLAVSVEISVSAFPYCEKLIALLSGFEEKECSGKPRSLILCYALEGDTLYSVGRRYDVPQSAIRRIAGKAGEELACGEPLMFIGR